MTGDWISGDIQMVDRIESFQRRLFQRALHGFVFFCYAIFDRMRSLKRINTSIFYSTVVESLSNDSFSKFVAELFFSGFAVTFSVDT